MAEEDEMGKQDVPVKYRILVKTPFSRFSIDIRCL
jgi:hypothetical protein